MPFSNFNKARAYYGPSLSDPRDQPEHWSDSPQKLSRPIGGQLTNFAASVAGLGGLVGLGYAKFGSRTGWDYAVPAMRAFEEYSPFRMFRTFQLSAAFSPFESITRKSNVFLSPELLGQNKQYTEYLRALIGKDPTRLLQEGVSLKGGRLFWGQGKDVALEYASAMRVADIGGSANLGAAYAWSLNAKRIKGAPSFPSFFSARAPYKNYPDILNPQIEGMPIQIIGGKNITQHWYRKAAALGTEQISRFNRLLGMFPVIGSKLEVKPTGGLRMLGKLSAKFGLGLGAASLGYEYLDWKARQSTLLDETRFSEGITYGLASIPAQAHIMAARASEALGLSAFARGQEEIAPGSTSLTKLAAFPLMGAFGVGTAMYASRVAKMVQLKKAEGLSVSLASERAGEWVKSFERFGKFSGNIERGLNFFTRKGGLLGRAASRMTPLKLGMLGGAVAGGLLVAPFIPGALFPQQTPEELEDIYSGRQEVPIRRGRFWEAGRSPFEGGAISYYRPHQLALTRTAAREKAIWEEDYEKLNPIERWYKANFTYELEAKHFKDRPYPVSGLPFQDVPFVGPILSATIGRAFKPELYMHINEWMGSKGIKSQPPAFGARIATEIGQELPGAPETTSTVGNVIGEQIYRVGTEMIGLTGFLTAAVKERITGSQDWFDQLSRLETSARITSYEREYWDKELGGLFMLSEPWRRLFPHRRRQIDRVNPIRNQMPEWLSGPGEKGPDFLSGDPFAKIPYGETRLPGPGLEALYPELKGVPHEEYSPSWRMKILGDVAPYTEKYKQALSDVRSARGREGWTEEDEQRYQTTKQQVKRKKQKVEFQEYKYLSAMGEISSSGKTESSDLMAAINQWKASGQKKPSLFEKYFGGYWELLSHNAETAFDQLTPISPGAKLVHTRSPIESYEREILYGQSAAFWQHPVSHFIAPFSRSAAHALGYEGVPKQAQTIRDIEQHFDILKYVKNARLSNLARIAGDTAAVKEFEKNKDETLFGVNPYTRNYSSLYRSLPRRERDYFSAFENAGTMEEKQRILEMVPENEKDLYIARWKLVHADELRKAKKAGILTDKQEEEAEARIESVYREAKSEGFPTSEELLAEYLKTKQPGESYADWYRRVKILANMSGIPGPDYVGFHPSVDLEDIKLKLVQHMGEEPIPFNLWPSREKELLGKPYITDEVLEPLLEEEDLSSEEIKSRINELLFADRMDGDVFITTAQAATEKNEVAVNLDIEEDNTEEQERLLREAINA